MPRSVHVVPVLALLAASCLAGCRRGAGAGSAGETTSPLEREAQQVVLADIQKHWVKGPDGWTSALTQGSPYAPDHFLRQYKEIPLRAVAGDALDESDRLNGVEFSGRAIFNEVPGREAGDPGIAFEGMAGINLMRARGRWTPWVNYTPQDIRVRKIKGVWQVAQDTTLTSGTIPSPADYANAGVH